ncbi:MAG: Hpt domain-containing protein [Alphaproteobacteria bacterium]|nr:Hpt domain-containing protein [Alphaproteobacteria bacterium]
MSKEHPIELFMPPNMLKAKVGGSIGGLDMAAIKRAEAAVETLKSDFAGWVGDDVERLSACRDRFAKKQDAAARDDLFRAGHDIKGQATTFEFPLVARVASSLCKLMDAVTAPGDVPLHLVDAHVSAIRIIFRDGIKDSSNRMAIELAEELEARVVETCELAA